MRRTLAIVAAFFVLLRPFCDVLAAAPTHDLGASHLHALADQGSGDEQSREPPCCASLGDGTLVKLAEYAAVPAASEGKLMFAAPSSYVRDAGKYNNGSAASRHPPGVVPLPASFYARSARIRR